ncbi:hypothetical protein FNV43_RR09861 [Rhamnella rubrinervis]|uniref:Uncharacterized protein n=1 Tax=Rhamnella rubrinervis TaxID=2594499 RepID=A0A8K0MK66_9ROSA|nr:hypothetical protein FNV43_RR09861 [Rhamnella rubrinervis]
MATVNHLSSIHNSPPSLRLFSPQTSQITPTLSFYSHSKPSFTFSSLTLKPLNAPKARALVITGLQEPLGDGLVTVPEATDQLAENLPSDSGVYAVFDSNSELQFVGISRNIAASVLAHRKSVPELCSSVKVGVVAEPDRTALTQAWKSWMEEHIKATGKVPSGNETGNTTWIRQAPKKKPDLADTGPPCPTDSPARRTH